jgi:7-cyano-7-deazaguanine synthase
MKKKAVVLLSGGLDSTTCLGLAMRDGFEPVCLSIDYGQRHSVELERAKSVAKAHGVKDHRVVKLDLRAIGGSALTDDIAVPKHDDVSQVKAEIPPTYVPARNTIFLGLALGLAEVVNSTDIFIGVNAVDYSGYPDCRPEFVRAFENLATLATKAGVEGARFTIHAPLSGMTKADIVRAGMAAGVDYSLTHSCYDPSPEGLACGRCDSCLLRKKGFEEAGVPDPTRYVGR